MLKYFAIVMKLLTDFYGWKYVILLQSFWRMYEIKNSDFKNTVFDKSIILFI